jgi:hypothetical protein
MKGTRSNQTHVVNGYGARTNLAGWGALRCVCVHHANDVTKEPNAPQWVISQASFLPTLHCS